LFLVEMLLYSLAQVVCILSAMAEDTMKEILDLMRDNESAVAAAAAKGGGQSAGEYKGGRHGREW
jgi:hypothetical protein